MLRRVIAALGATVVLGFASTAKAQVPAFLTEEGKLLDGAGNPITTPVTPMSAAKFSARCSDVSYRQESDRGAVGRHR